MKLNELFENQPDIEIKHIMYDSRDRLDNSLFACLSGIRNDAHKFVDQAIGNGAVAIIHSKDLKSYQDGIAYIRVDNVEEVFPEIVNRFFNYPSDKLWLIGVTGTNGKSSVTTLIKRLLNQTKPTGLLGTINIEFGDHIYESSYTTADLVSNQEILSTMLENGIEAVAMEVSSQGIDQNRVAGLKFDVAVFTNLTADHLDFHLSMENYYQAKKKLFTNLDDGKIAIINIDDPYGERLKNELVLHSLTVSFTKNATYQIKNVKLEPNFSSFDLVHEDIVYPVKTNLLGRFNCMNLVQAMAAVHQSGVELMTLIPLVEKLDIIEGRMEAVNLGQPFNVIVDFAHTPDGFDKIMRFARSVTDKKNRVIAVFGAPGQRDKSKRVIFGEMVEEFCDLAILTEDDNRDELVIDICHEIAKGIKSKPTLIVENRIEAIRQAMTLAHRGDTVLLLAKGTEKFIARQTEKEPYAGDKKVAIDILRELKEELNYDRESE